MNAWLHFNRTSVEAFYLWLNILTFVLHFLSVSYVVGGVLTLLRGAVKGVEENTISRLVRDWTPFLLSVAITLGVAPLLFMQVLYPAEIYTAHLLLGWHWLMVVPSLILGFYLLYVLKTDAYLKLNRMLRLFILFVTCGCVLFVGFNWSTAHVLTQVEGHWVPIYERFEEIHAVTPFIVVRTVVWLGGMLFTFPLLAGWQVVGMGSNPDAEMLSSALRQLRTTVRTGGILLLVGTALILFPSSMSEWGHTKSPLFLGYLACSGVAGGLYWLSWETLRSVRGVSGRFLWMTFLWIGGGVSAGAAREINRMQIMFYLQHQRGVLAAAKVGGFPLFVAFLIINALLIAYCIRMVLQRLREPVDPST